MYVCLILHCSSSAFGFFLFRYSFFSPFRKSAATVSRFVLFEAPFSRGQHSGMQVAAPIPYLMNEETLTSLFLANSAMAPLIACSPCLPMLIIL